MNINQLKMFFSDKLPLELAFGYTMERRTLHIILYEDKLSRIETDSYGNVLDRLDQSGNIQMYRFTENHKRFYPNRVNKEFVSLLESFGVYMAITNVDANSKPKFEFGEVVTDLAFEDKPKVYFKLNEKHPDYEATVNEFRGNSYFLKAEKRFDNVFYIGDARKTYAHLEDIYVTITQSDYEKIKELWEYYNQVGQLQIVPLWCILDKNVGKAVEVYTDLRSAEENIQKYWIDNNFLFRVRQGYGIQNKDGDIIDSVKFHHTHEEALLRAYEVHFEHMIKGEDKYFMSINEIDTEKYMVYTHCKNNFEDDRKIELWNEMFPGDKVTANKVNFKEIAKYEYLAILSTFKKGVANNVKLWETVLNR